VILPFSSIDDSIDDSILEKAHTHANAMITTHWDHSEKRFVQGLNFVSLLYQLGELSLPIAGVLIEKTVAEYNVKRGKYEFVPSLRMSS